MDELKEKLRESPDLTDKEAQSAIDIVTAYLREKGFLIPHPISN